MGRPNKPTNLHDLEGTYRGDRQNPDEPRLPVELPDRPPWVDDDDRTALIFDQVTKYITEMQVGASVDGIALSLLADQLATYIEIRQQIRDEGLTVEVTTKASGTYEKPHHLLTALNQCYGNIFKMLTQYGLTAASRAHVSAAPNDADDFESFLNNS